jgi:hypothetical protein
MGESPADLERAIGRLVLDDDEMLSEKEADLLCQFDVPSIIRFSPDHSHVHYFFAYNFPASQTICS